MSQNPYLPAGDIERTAGDMESARRKRAGKLWIAVGISLLALLLVATLILVAAAFFLIDV